MKHRVSETITIHNGDRDVLVPITPQSRYVYNLMSGHYIILEFVLSEAIQFAIGDWIISKTNRCPPTTIELEVIVIN